jgi:type I restriction enzyme S subunit
MSISSYQSYKNSGVEWLGKIPVDWSLGKFRHLFTESTEKIESEVHGAMLSVSGYRGIEIKEYSDENQKRTDENLIGYRIVHVGQLVVNTMWLNYAGLGISQHEGHVSPAYRSYWVDSNLHKPFVHHLMRSSLYVLGYTKYLTGVRPNSLQMSREDLMNFPILIPTLTEQKSIANFLDHETAKIDTLIAEQEKLIELLKEKRQAVISQAVTNGLDSKVKVKDSGVVWLGRVPESWDVIRLKKITTRISSGKTPSGGADVYLNSGVIFLRSQNVYDEGLRLEDVVRIPEKVDAEMSSSRVKGGDILLNITGGSIGRSCCVPNDFEPANVNQHVCAIRLTHPDMVSFVELFFKSDIIKKQIDYIQNGAAREGLNFEQIGNFSICIPPKQERELLVEEVRRKIKSFNDLTSQIIELITLLQERRSTLISAAVSGQIDVRTSNGN